MVRGPRTSPSVKNSPFIRFATVAGYLAVLLAASAAPASADERRQSSDELQWFKGNTHTHSLWSDGNDFPEMIADWYRQHGYHFLVISDHNVLSQGDRWMKHEEIVKRGGKEALAKYRARFGDDWVQTRGEPDSPEFEVRLKPLNEFRKLVEASDRFVLIQGEEISDRAEGVPVHINAANLEELIEPMGGRTVAEAIDNNLRAVEEQAARTGREIFAHLNHPNFGLAITAEEMASVLRERYFEVYNGHPGVMHLGDERHPGVERLWDIANTIRLGQLSAPPLFGVATDDSHHYHGEPGSRPGRGWIMVRAGGLDSEALIRAIKKGDFYASSGVTLEDVQYDRTRKKLRLSIRPDDGAEYTTQFIGTRKGYDASSEPAVDDEGQPLRATRVYSSDVGEVLAKVSGVSPEYQLKGDELYVRAVVTSTLPHRDPSFEEQRQQAWTQPVGWEKPKK
jgi:hypothetical protein